MKVLAINGSARKDGNTAMLINAVFEELNKAGIETEMVQLSGTIIEPCKACWACGGRKNCVHKKDLFQYKVGAAVTAARRGGALTTLDAMNHFFMLQNMFVVGSSYWAMAYGQMQGDVHKDEEGLDTMRNLGQNMVYLLKSLNGKEG